MKTDINYFYIIDDDDSVCRSLGILLTSYGFCVNSFSSAEDFLNKVPNHAPGCLIIDIHLPGLNGWELHRCLLESGSKRPVFIITADKDAGFMSRAYQTGAAGFLEKPFKYKELNELIQLLPGFYDSVK